MAAGPRIFTIPGGAAFLPTLAEALLDGALVPGFAPRRDPLALADATIFLPTRRAGRAFADALLDALGSRAALLPRMAPLGDVDDEGDFDEPEGADGEDLALPPPIEPLDRRLVLARMAYAWGHGLAAGLIGLEPGEPVLIGTTATDAWALGGELARFLDSFTAEHPGAPPELLRDRLAAVVPEEHDEAFALIRRFLDIVAEAYPQFLAASGRLDPVDHRDRRLARLAARIAAGHARGPVIAAGSTGSVPATAALLAAIAGAPNGAVVLPGLDQGVDAASAELVLGDEPRVHGHPQAGLARLIHRLGVARDQVLPLGTVGPEVARRIRLVNDALRPADTTDLWAAERGGADGAAVRAALAGVALAEAPNERAEATTVAVLLRETLEDPAATAALVTPDRELARRVAAELARWEIAVDDSAGEPLATSGAGIFARLLVAAVAGGFAAPDLAALLAHPRAAFGLDPAAARRAAAALDVAALRRPRIGRGVAALARALDAAERELAEGRHVARALRLVGDRGVAAARRLLAAIERACAPLGTLAEAETPLRRAAGVLIEALAAAGATREEPDAAFAGNDGEALADALAALAEVEDDGIALTLADLPAFLRVHLGDIVVRPQPTGRARVQILGLLEARLLTFDRLVLGGLDEGVWPPAPQADPFLSRPMRRALGLPPPERRIGLTAHDFAQALGHRDVVLTRALKRQGAPTVASRFVQRLAALAGAEAWGEVVARGAQAVELALALDRPAARTPPIAPPEPRPPLELRPARLSVSEIATLVRDPYAIFARHVLRLELLDERGAAPGARERGTAIHEAVARFVLEGHDPAGGGALATLVELGREAFGPLLADEEVAALWWPRFERLAAAFIEAEAARRPQLAASSVEIRGTLAWTTAAGREFTLVGRADRIDRLADGRIEILDYKTGVPPTARVVASGLEPQLALEGAMAAAGSFGAEHAAELAGLTVVQLSGGREPVRVSLLDFARAADLRAAEVATRSLARLKWLIDRFEDEATPYRSRVAVAKERRRDGDYDHLARVREWSAGGGEEEGA